MHTRHKPHVASPACLFGALWLARTLVQACQSEPTTLLEHDRILRRQIGDFGEIVQRLGLKAT